MAKLYDFGEAERAKLTSKLKLISEGHLKSESVAAAIESQLKFSSEIAEVVATELFELMQQDQIAAVTELPRYIKRVRDLVYGKDRAFIESIAGGPAPEYTSKVTEILGIMYPSLEKDAKIKGLGSIVSFLSKFNISVIPNHVELINEPWLAADVMINVPYSWPGHPSYCKLLAENSSWESLLPKISKVPSEFWLSFTILKRKYASVDVRRKFSNLFPDLTDRTLDATAALITDEARRAEDENNIPYEDTVNRWLKKYEPKHIELLKKKMEEKNWIELGIY